MTEIILASPCLGKTYFANNHPNIALDLESSDYLFDRTGYEHLSSEEFKGIPNRKRNPNGVDDYVEAIKKVVKENKYKYVFIAQNPEIVRKVLKLGKYIHYVIPANPTLAKEAFRKRARERGNSNEWIERVVKFIGTKPDYLTDEELKQTYIHFIPSNSYLSDWIRWWN